MLESSRAQKMQAIMAHQQISCAKYVILVVEVTYMLNAPIQERAVVMIKP
jgi:hypothetical protein